MRFLEGDNLVDGIQQLGERAAQRQGLTLDDLKRDMLAKFEREGYPEPYAGPSPFVIEAYCSVWKSTLGYPHQTSELSSSADFWTNRLLSLSSRSTVEKLASTLSNTRTSKSG